MKAENEANGDVAFHEEDEKAPLIPGEPRTVSATWTLMNVLRGMVGAGCLALPVAFKQCGLWTGFVLIFVIGFLNTHCMLMLVHSSQYLCIKSGKPELDYGHLAKKAVDYGPEKLRKHSKKALYITNAIICFLQIGICSVAFVFMAEHLKQILDHFYPAMSKLNVRVYLCMFLVPVILLNLIRDLWILAYLSTVANLLIILSFAVILSSLITSSNEIRYLPSTPSSLGSFLSGFGDMLYSFEGQAMILPMENKMKEPKTMVGWNGVLCTGMAITTCIYAGTGFFGYASYGQNVTGSIAESFPFTPVYIAVRVMLIMAVFVGYGLMMYIIIEMLWPAIMRKMPSFLMPFHQILECVFRLVAVIITFLLAVAVPNLENIISLVGISLATVIALIFPPLIEIVTFWNCWTKTSKYIWWNVGKNILIIVLGVFAAIAGLTVTVQKLLPK